MPENIKKDVSLDMPISDIAGSCFSCGQSCCKDVVSLLRKKFKTMSIQIGLSEMEQVPLAGIHVKNTESYQTFQFSSKPRVNFYPSKHEVRPNIGYGNGLAPSSVSGDVTGERAYAIENKGPVDFTVKAVGCWNVSDPLDNPNHPPVERNIVYANPRASTVVGDSAVQGVIKTSGDNILPTTFYKQTEYAVVGYVESYRFLTVMGEDLEVTSLDTIDDQHYDPRKLWESGKTTTVVEYTTEWLEWNKNLADPSFTASLPVDENGFKQVPPEPMQFQEVEARGNYHLNRSAIMIKGLNRNDRRAERSLHPQNVASGPFWNMGRRIDYDLDRKEGPESDFYYDINQKDGGIHIDNERPYTNSKCPFHLVLVKYETPIIIGTYEVTDWPIPRVDNTDEQEAGKCSGTGKITAPEGWKTVVEVMSTRDWEATKSGDRSALRNVGVGSNRTDNPFGVATKYGPGGGIVFDDTAGAIKFIKDSWQGSSIISDMSNAPISTTDTLSVWSGLGGFDARSPLGVVQCLDGDSLTIKTMLGGVGAMGTGLGATTEFVEPIQPNYMVLKKNPEGGIDFYDPETGDTKPCITNHGPQGIGFNSVPDANRDNTIPLGDELREYPFTLGAQPSYANLTHPTKIAISSIKFSNVEELAKTSEFSFNVGQTFGSSIGQMSTVFEKELYYNGLYPYLKTGACAGGSLPYDWDGALTTWSDFICAYWEPWGGLYSSSGMYGIGSKEDNVFSLGYSVHAAGSCVFPENDAYWKGLRMYSRWAPEVTSKNKLAAWCMKDRDTRYHHNTTFKFAGAVDCDGSVSGAHSFSYDCWAPDRYSFLPTKLSGQNFADYALWGNEFGIEQFLHQNGMPVGESPFTASSLDETIARTYLTTAYTSDQLFYNSPVSQMIVGPNNETVLVDASEFTINNAFFTRHPTWATQGSILTGSFCDINPSSRVSLGDFTAKFEGSCKTDYLVWWSVNYPKSPGGVDSLYLPTWDIRNPEGGRLSLDAKYGKPLWFMTRPDLQMRSFSAVDITRLTPLEYPTLINITFK
jgi:hypothetical protein